MRRRILCWVIILIGLLTAVLELDRYFGLFDRGPRFRFRSASAWSFAIKRGETVFGWPEDEKGRTLGRYLPNDGTPSFYFRRLRYMIWPEPCYAALKQRGLGMGPDGTCRLGEDVKPAAV